MGHRSSRSLAGRQRRFHLRTPVSDPWERPLQEFRSARDGRTEIILRERFRGALIRIATVTRVFQKPVGSNRSHPHAASSGSLIFRAKSLLR